MERFQAQTLNGSLVIGSAHKAHCRFGDLMAVAI
jgi:hypothetical protein